MCCLSNSLDFTAHTNTHTESFIGLLDYSTQVFKNLFPLQVLLTVSLIYSFSIPTSRKQMKRNVEIVYNIFYLNSMSFLQHICSLLTHGSLNPLCTNFYHENCQFSLITFTLCRCLKSPSLLHKLLKSSCLLEQYCR